MAKIDGERVILTGASSGIGKALAFELARKGARIALTSDRLDLLKMVADEITSIFQRDHAQNKVYPVSFQKHEIRIKEAIMNMKLLIQSICIIAIASFGQISCSHTPERPKVLSDDLRVNFGTIGVVSARFEPNIFLRTPKDKSAGALSGAGASTLSWLEVAGSMGQGGILLLPFIPIAAVGGAIAGGLSGVSGEKVEEAKASIRTAIKDLKIQETLIDQIMENAREETPYPLVRVEGVGPISPMERVSYHSLPGMNLESLLEIGVTGCNLEGTGYTPGSGLGYINSTLWISMDTRVRLVRIADGREIFSRSFTTRCYGQRLKFLEWGANDAALFRQEIKNCLPSVRDRIVRNFLAPFRDLTGKWMFLNQICSVEGCEISGRFIIRNAGNLDATASLVRFYLSEDGVYDEGRDLLLKEVTTKAIEGGESQPIWFNYRLGTGQDVRRKYIITIIDEENRVVESNKENNYAIGTIE
ncbi:MAG: hypothetical protein A2157_12170 [Deltaproteobacteria bacterium RBG_16_47_11]|nr:MAG: hypothetical protein A2157_12170 [Deltaproteobacteria bacterium RBG_16_47_11]